MLRITMIIVLIMTMNLVGISYGYWQDNPASIITSYTGYIELSFKDELKISSDEFDATSARLVGSKGSKVIEIDGTIERDIEGSAKGELLLEYIVENNGSLPVKLDEIQIEDSQMEWVTVEGPYIRDIGSKDSLTDSVTIKVDVPAAADSQGDDIESDGLEDTSDEYEFEIVFIYKISSWTDKLTIKGTIEVAPSNDMISLPVLVPAVTLIPVQGEIVTDGLLDGTEPEPIPEGPSDEELYGEGGTTVETDEPETTEGEGEEEGSGDQEQTGADDEPEESDEPEAVEDDSEPASAGDDEGESSDDQEQIDAGEATVEADEPEEVEDNSEPASAGDDEGESSDNQEQTDAGERSTE
jgi:hypothetical protein